MAERARPSGCSFCGRPESKVDKIMYKGNVGICDECAATCMKAFNGGGSPENGQFSHEDDIFMTPVQIKERLDEYVVGQDKAKMVLSVAVYNHYKRLRNNENGSSGTDIRKSNILMIGPSGSGKTYLAQTMAKILDVPFAIADATTMTEAGYVGADVESAIKKLLDMANGDVEKAQRGIVYIDEIDKIARKGEGSSVNKDVAGEGVQTAMLKMLEDTVIDVQVGNSRRNPMGHTVSVDTKDILFICGGAFTALDKILRTEDDAPRNGIGFGAKVEPHDKELEKRDPAPADLVRFGLIPELVGRLPVIVTLNDMDEDLLVKIMEEPKDSVIKGYQQLFRMDGVNLVFEPDAKTEIARKALKNGTGARGLRAITENILLNTMFYLPSRKEVTECVVTRDAVLGKGEPFLKSQIGGKVYIT